MSVSQNFPNIAPSLSLDFANVKALDSRVTFARASSARYYNGRSVAKAEENLQIRSQEMDSTAGWAVGDTTVTANTTSAPDGTTTAETLTETATTAAHFLITQNGSFSTISGQTYTSSCFFKKGTGASAPDIIQMTFRAGGFTSPPHANFDISVGGETSGTVVGGSAEVAATITAAGNGWYRCSITATASSASSTTGTGINFCNNNPSSARAPSYAGNTNADIFLWGAQLEQRSAVTAYTPTTTQPITNYIPTLLAATDNVARFDHNPTTGESLGLLVEEQRTNLLLRSEGFDNAAWTKTDINGTLTANAAVAPDGNLTAELFQEDTTNNPRVIRQAVSSSGSNTFALYAKQAYGNRFLTLYMTNSGFLGTARVHATFDLTLGTVTISGATGAGVFTSASITPVGNGWYRCAVIGETLLNRCISINAVNNTSIAASYTGDGYSGIYIWGAQLEAGAFPTSYIPTVASQVTRSADAASMTGANFSSWYNQGEGTMYGEVVDPKGTVLFGTGNTFDNTAYITTGASGNVTIRSFGAAVATFSRSVPTAGATKAAFAYKTNDFNAASSGTASTTDTSGTVPYEQVRLSFGSSPWQTAPGAMINGYIRKLSYYPKRLTNEQLQALTS